MIHAIVEAHVNFAGPNLSFQFFAGDEIAGTFEKGGEDLDGLRLVLEAGAVFPQLAGVNVEFIRPEAEFDRCGSSFL